MKNAGRKTGYVLLYTLLTWAGYYPDDPEYVDDRDLVYTNFDSSFRFSSFHIYSIPCSVVRITDLISGNIV